MKQTFLIKENKNINIQYIKLFEILVFLESILYNLNSKKSNNFEQDPKYFESWRKTGIIIEKLTVLIYNVK